MAQPRTKLIIIGAAVGTVVLGGAAGLAEFLHTAVQTRNKAEAITRGSVERGARLFSAYGCGTCHTAIGVQQADAKVGPPLTGIASRLIIAGRLANKPENMERWIMDPQAISPGNAMPNLHVGASDARDITAFLYTQG